MPRDHKKKKKKIFQTVIILLKNIYTIYILFFFILGAQRPDHVTGAEQVRRGGLAELQRRDHGPAGRHAGEGRQDHPWQLQRELGQVRNLHH